MAESMYRRPSRLWVLRVYARRDPLTGRKLWRSRTVRGTKREAERALAAFVTEQPSAQAPAPSRTFGVSDTPRAWAASAIERTSFVGIMPSL